MTSLLSGAYQQLFRRYPDLTLAVTGACVASLGDASAQLVEDIVNDTEPTERERAYDVTRTARFFCYGLMIGPLMGRSNVFLEQRIPTLREGRAVSYKALSKRLAIDQLVMAPLMGGFFIGSMSLMEGRNLSQTKEKFGDLYTKVLVANWKFRLATQLFNLRYMPLIYRVPFLKTSGVFWTLYLSLMNSKQSVLEDLEEEKSIKDTIDQPSPLLDMVLFGF